LTGAEQPRNDGRRLEDIVALIEGMRLPPSFEAKQRQRIYDEDGVQIAELDIVITGRVGTSTWKSLIQCRDRPSKHSAPTEWIEQLIGRRIALKLDKVTAVSSTPFSPGAIDLAQRSGIELRTLQAITAEDIAMSFPSLAPLILFNTNLTSTHLTLMDPERVSAEEIKLPWDRTSIVDNATKQRLTCLELWSRVVGPAQLMEVLWGRMGSGTTTVSVGESILKGYSAEVDGATYRFSSAEFDVSWTMENSNMPLARAETYADEHGERRADVAHWLGEPTDLIQGLTIIGIRKPPSES
jgi:hypothetical protein